MSSRRYSSSGDESRSSNTSSSRSSLKKRKPRSSGSRYYNARDRRNASERVLDATYTNPSRRTSQSQQQRRSTPQQPRRPSLPRQQLTPTSNSMASRRSSRGNGTPHPRTSRALYVPDSEAEVAYDDRLYQTPPSRARRQASPLHHRSASGSPYDSPHYPRYIPGDHGYVTDEEAVVEFPPSRRQYASPQRSYRRLGENPRFRQRTPSPASSITDADEWEVDPRVHPNRTLRQSRSTPEVRRRPPIGQQQRNRYPVNVTPHPGDVPAAALEDALNGNGDYPAPERPYVHRTDRYGRVPFRRADSPAPWSIRRQQSASNSSSRHSSPAREYRQWPLNASPMVPKVLDFTDDVERPNPPSTVTYQGPKKRFLRNNRPDPNGLFAAWERTHPNWEDGRYRVPADDTSSAHNTSFGSTPQRRSQSLPFSSRRQSVGSRTPKAAL